MKAFTEFKLRLDLVQRIGSLNACRMTFTQEERHQFIVAAEIFSVAELQEMLVAAEAAAQRRACSTDRTRPAMTVAPDC